jgi:hypothetical protein
MYLIIFRVYLKIVPDYTCTVLYSLHQIQVLYLISTQVPSIKLPLTHVQGGLLLGDGDGGAVVR